MRARLKLWDEIKIGISTTIVVMPIGEVEKKGLDSSKCVIQ